MRYILLCLLFMGCATDPWTKNQVLLQGTCTALNMIDYGQTLDIAKKPDQFREVNPILGEHPSTGRVNTYFALASLAKLGITHILPSKYRKWWLGFNIAVSGYCVGNNYHIGARVNF